MFKGKNSFDVLPVSDDDQNLVLVLLADSFGTESSIDTRYLPPYIIQYLLNKISEIHK